MTPSSPERFWPCTGTIGRGSKKGWRGWHATRSLITETRQILAHKKADHADQGRPRRHRLEDPARVAAGRPHHQCRAVEPRRNFGAALPQARQAAGGCGHHPRLSRAAQRAGARARRRRLLPDRPAITSRRPSSRPSPTARATGRSCAQPGWSRANRTSSCIASPAISAPSRASSSKKLTSSPNVDTVRTALTIRQVKDEGLVGI